MASHPVRDHCLAPGREAEVREGGERLGPVGGTIVTEVLCGIADLDPTSYRAAHPAWRPTPAEPGAGFGLGELLAFSEAH